MAMLMITCPATGRRVSTGIETDPASLALIPPVNTRLDCPACGRQHLWSVLDAEPSCPEFECSDSLAPEWERWLKHLNRHSARLSRC